MSKKFRSSVTVYSDNPVDVIALTKAVQKFGRVADVSSNPVAKWDYDFHDEEEEELISCFSCGISNNHEDFGDVAHSRVNRTSGQWDYFCAVCAIEEGLDGEDK
jgi:hypothetical protein